MTCRVKSAAGQSLFDAVVARRPDIRAAKPENQNHVCRPGTNAFDRGEHIDELGIGKRVSAAQEDTLRRVANRFGAAALVSAQEQITRAEKNLKFNANLPMCLEELFAGILEGR